MKLARAIKLLKKFPNYREFREPNGCLYYSANVYGHPIATFQCAVPEEAGAPLHINPEGKMCFAGKSLTMLVSICKMNPRKLKPFTVTVEGPERHDGEKPYTYVVKASSFHEAGLFVVYHHKQENDVTDVNLVGVQAGIPRRDCGYHWNDLRTVSETVEA